MSTLFAQLNANNNTMLNSYKVILCGALASISIFVTTTVPAQKQFSEKRIISLGFSGTSSYTGKTTFIETDGTSNHSQELSSIPNDLGSIYGKFLAYNPLNNKIYLTDVSDGVNTEISIWELADKTIRQQNKFIVKNKIISQFDFDSKGTLYSIEDFNSSKKEAWVIAYKLLDNAAIILNEKKIVFDDKNELKNIKDGDVTISADGKIYALFSDKNSVLYEIKNFNTTTPFVQAAAVAQFPEYCYSLYNLNGKIIAAGNTLQLKNYYFTYSTPENTFTKCIDVSSENLLFETVCVNVLQQKNSLGTTSGFRVIQNETEAFLQISNEGFIHSRIEILNTQGEIVITTKENNQSSFSIKSLSNGVYFAKISSAEGYSKTAAFCVFR